MSTHGNKHKISDLHGFGYCIGPSGCYIIVLEVFKQLLLSKSC